MSVRFQLTMLENLAARQWIPLAESIRGLVDSPEIDLTTRVVEIVYSVDTRR